MDVRNLWEDGERDDTPIVYMLFDDGGFNMRNSRFLMQVNTVFEHRYGTYKVTQVVRTPFNIQVHCERLNSKTPNLTKAENLNELNR